MSDETLSRRARDMARNIQGNLGRCLYRRKDVAEMEEVSETLMELADELNAKLGSDDDYERKMDTLLCRLTNGKWSKSRAYSVEFMVSCIDEEFEALYNEEQFSAPVSGTLTAEQVRETVDKHGVNDGCVYSIFKGSFKAIADELNAELGSGTCEPELTVYNEASDDELFRCSYCHCKVYNIDMTEGDCGWGFTFCPQCGGEVYESDSRKIEAKLDETTNGIGGETNGIHADAPLVDGDAVSIMRDLRGCVDVPMLKDTLCRETGTDNLVDALETLADMIERDYVSRQDFAAQHRTLCGVREQRDEAREQVDAMRDVVRDFLDERDEWKTKFEAREFAYKQADAERKRYSEQIDELIAEIGSGTCKLIADLQEDKRTKTGYKLACIHCSACGEQHSGSICFRGDGSYVIYRDEQDIFCRHCGSMITNDVDELSKAVKR